jgi:hypothetical protein
MSFYTYARKILNNENKHILSYVKSKVMSRRTFDKKLKSVEREL